MTHVGAPVALDHADYAPCWLFLGCEFCLRAFASERAAFALFSEAGVFAFFILRFIRVVILKGRYADIQCIV